MSTKNEVSGRFIAAFEYLLKVNVIADKKDFANKLGISPSMVTEISKGRSAVGTTAIQNIVLFFNISGDWLLTGEGEMLKTNGIPRNTPPPVMGKSQGKDTENISDSQENKVQISEDIPSLLAYMKEKDAIHREELKAKDLIIEQKNQELRALDRQVAQLEGELRQYRTAASSPTPLPGTPPMAQ